MGEATEKVRARGGLFYILRHYMPRKPQEIVSYNMSQIRLKGTKLARADVSALCKDKFFK